MVLAYYPQMMKRSLATNSDYAPQGVTIGEGVSGLDKLVAAYTLADPSFEFSKTYLINEGQVAGAEVNEPFVILDTLPAGTLQEASDFDIRAFDSSDNPIPYQIGSITDIGGGIKEIEVWVKLAAPQDNDFIHLLFGKPSATDEQSTDVWDSDFRVAYHMQEIVDFKILDKTSNDNDLDLVNVTITDGQIRKSGNFSGSNSLGGVIDNASLDITSAITLSAWVKTDGSGYIIGKEIIPSSRPYSMLMSGSTGSVSLRFGIETSAGFNIFNSASFISETDFVYAVCTYDGSQMRIYLDGILSSSLAQTGNMVVNNVSLNIGIRSDLSVQLDGQIDEVSIASKARSADWILTQFNNQKDNDAFWTKLPLVERLAPLIDDLGNNFVAEVA